MYTFIIPNYGELPGWSASGSFSIPVADFTAAPVISCFDVPTCVSLPNTDIVAASFTIDTPNRNATVGLSDVNSLGFNAFNVSFTLPQLAYGTTNQLVNTPGACEPFSSSCGVGIEAAFFGNTIYGPEAPPLGSYAASTDISWPVDNH